MRASLRRPGVTLATDGGEGVVDPDDDGDNPDECDCGELPDGCSCWPCYRDGAEFDG